MELTLVADRLGYARLEAALSAFSVPMPDPSTGDADPRTHEQRRYDALMQLVEEAVAGAGPLGRTGPLGTTAQVVVTVTAEHLRDGGIGVCLLDGRPLRTDDVEQLMCEADVRRLTLGDDLCQHHHTQVHSRGMRGRVDRGTVVWGSRSDGPHAPARRPHGGSEASRPVRAAATTRPRAPGSSVRPRPTRSRSAGHSLHQAGPTQSSGP